MTAVRKIPSETIEVTLRGGIKRTVDMDGLLMLHYHNDLAGSEWPEKFNQLRALNLELRKKEK